MTIPELVREAYSSWDDAEALSRAGRELHDRNRLDLAREVLSRALEIGANDADTWASYAYTHLRGFMHDEGIQILREGIGKTDSDFLRGVLASFTSDAEERKALQDKMKENDDPEVEAALASARLWAGDKSAFDELRSIHEAHAHNAHIRDTWLWVLFASAGKPGGEMLDLKAEAVPVADKKIADRPGISGHWMKAQLLHLAKDWDGLLAATDAALETYPDEETMMYLRGRAFREKGDDGHAAECFTRAIGMKPTYVGARTELGKVYESQGKLAHAEEIFREGPRVNPGYLGGPISLAAFLGRRERWEEAESLFLETWPKLPPFLQQRVRQAPENAPLFTRDRVKAALGD